MIQAIIFDCFGVLTDTGDLWKQFVENLPEEHKEPARILNRALDSGMLSHADFYTQIHQLTGHEPRQVENIITAEMDKNAALLSYIAELKKVYKIGLLSNISSNWIRDTFLNSQEAALFDDMVFSYQEGTVKPDPRIYELAAEHLGLEPEDCVFVDDSQRNCDGAAAVGMQTLLYTDFTRLKSELTTLLNHT